MSYTLISSMKKYFFLLALSLLTLGAGCSTTQKPPASTSKSAASTSAELQAAYLNCIEKNHTVEIRFNSEKNKNEVYCVFSEGKECEVREYQQGSCDENTSAPEIRIEDGGGEPLPIPLTRRCEAKAKPVCGVDGQTYTNTCTAELNNVKVKHEGLCTAEELVQDEVVQKENTKPNTKTVSNTTKTQTNTQATETAPVQKNDTAVAPSGWSNFVEALAQKKASSPTMTFSSCKINNKTFYLQKEECPNCFRVLFTETGSVACYPGFDSATNCPNLKESECKLIWKK